MKFYRLPRSLLAAALAFCYAGAQAASQAPVAAENGMVVTAQHLASRARVDVLTRGGNAVGAAVAVGPHPQGLSGRRRAGRAVRHGNGPDEIRRVRTCPPKRPGDPVRLGRLRSRS